mmetsp:Transcript_8697/g.16478  ORF Transcript_8697/g.16478 Transcript_8697/m.16478 type:complete len:404 (+) Transcript_8697:183-1394(+)
MQPTQNDAVAAFKQQLGIHAAEDADFGWIAEVGLQSPLPPRWTSHADDDSGYVYYVDHDRQVSSWENPLVPYLRHVVEIGRKFMEDPSETFFEDQKGVLWHQHKTELDCWHGPFADDCGRRYYVNSTEGISSWQDPRIDAQYIFELESGLLTSLEEVLNRPRTPETPEFGPDGIAFGGDPRRTANGAEVLTLEPSRGKGSRPGTAKPDLANQLLNQAQMDAKECHRSTLQQMMDAAARLHSQQQNDLETQRIHFSRKVEARRQRQQLKASPTARIPSAATFLKAAGRPTPLQLDDTGIGDGASGLGMTLHHGEVSKVPPPPPPLTEALPPQEDQSPILENSTISSPSGLLFKPPVVPPSTLAGQKPIMAAELEERLKYVADKPEAFQGSTLGSIELGGGEGSG